MRHFVILIIVCISTFSNIAAQSKKASSSKDAVLELSKSLEEGKPDNVVAKDYENLAIEFQKSGDYKKAEENYEKAKALYLKIKDTEKVAFIEREIAKLKEHQNEIEPAISKYQSASKLSKQKSQQALNTNDANRLMNRSNPAIQSDYIQQNIHILEETGQAQEKSQAYTQMAEVSMEMEDVDGAISNLNSALEYAETAEEEIKINRKMADVYVAVDEPEKAVEIKEELVKKAKETNDPAAEIKQLQDLSKTYFENSATEKGLESLRKAYELALENGRTLEAKESAVLLAEYYAKKGQLSQAIKVYVDFAGRLEHVIQSDCTLVDSKILQVNEDKIARLEKERILKDELIRKQRLFSNSLLVVAILIAALLVAMIIAWFSIRVKNRRIALQSLRREMNPHFIFNSLNSVNEFIAENNELEANKYLASYSKLMRNTMENSNRDFIPLSVELVHLKEYLQLEHMRFRDKFTYEIILDESIDPDAVMMPNMLIQPQLENAIWHGLRYKQETGHLIVEIKRLHDMILVRIEDDGIGIEQSRKLKTIRQKEHSSRGLSNTHERINLLNHLYHTDIRLQIEDKSGEATGVIVTIRIPISKKERK